VLEPSIQIHIGSRYTRVVHAVDHRLVAPRALPHSPVLLAAAQAEAARASGAAASRLVRATARQVAEQAGLESLVLGCPVIGVGSIARAVIARAGDGCSSVTTAQLQATTQMLAVAWVARQRGMPFQRLVDPILIGAAILEATLEFLEADRITAMGSSDGDAGSSP